MEYLYGWKVGGQAGPSTAVERLTFLFSSGTASLVSNATYSRYYASSFNNSIYGFVGVGYVGSANSMIIERFEFPYDTGTSTTYQANATRSNSQAAGFNSSTHGFILGGIDGTGARYSQVERLSFPILGTNTDVGFLSKSKKLFMNGGFDSSTYGYTAGGDSAGSYLYDIERLTFPFASGTATLISYMSVSRALSACLNSTQHGFMIGGVAVSNYIIGVDRLIFSFDSTNAVVTGALAETTYSSCGIDGTDFVTLFI